MTRATLFLILMLGLSACSTSPRKQGTVQDLTARPRSAEAIQKDTPTAEEKDCKHTDASLRCVVFVKNYDADTLTVDLPGIHPYFGHNAHVRLLGIDTPEIKGSTVCEKEMAQKAKMFVQQILSSAKRIDLVDLGKEKFGRILATVLADGKNLNELLVTKGFAYRYFGERKMQRDWCKPLP